MTACPYCRPASGDLAADIEAHRAAQSKTSESIRVSVPAMNNQGGDSMFNNVKTKAVAVLSAAAVLGVVAASGASAADVVTPVITAATTDLQTTLLATGGAAIGIGGVVLALRKGWRFFKGMI